MENLILFLLFYFFISCVTSASSSHFCTETVPKNVEVEVSPKQEDSVPCLELYKSVSQSEWLYDEERMHRVHGGDIGVNRYFSSLGALAECFTMKLPVVKNIIIQEKVQRCCSGWTGKNCDTKDDSQFGVCFSEATCQIIQNSNNMMLITECCSANPNNFYKYVNSSVCHSCSNDGVENHRKIKKHQNNEMNPSNNQHLQQQQHSTSPRNLDRLRGLLNSAGIYVPKYRKDEKRIENISFLNYAHSPNPSNFFLSGHF